MLVKWIKCLVESQNKNLFSSAQEKWADLKETEGFIAQTGGWNIHNDNEACILSFWDDYSSYLEFMKFVHDGITNKNKQAETYVSIAVSLYDSAFKYNNNLYENKDIFGGSKLIRSTECTTYRGREAEYIETQNTVWGPAMTNVPGFTGGYFSRRVESESDFLVLTFWDSEKSHLDFIQDKFGQLKIQAGMDQHMEKLTPRIIRTENSWTVY